MHNVVVVKVICNLSLL